VSASHLKQFQFRKPEPEPDDAFEHPMAYLTLLLLSQFVVFALLG
jgi:hypothetical protein